MTQSDEQPTKLDYTTCPPLRDAFYEHTHYSYSNLNSDYSATELLRPPRVVQLSKRHKEEIDAFPFTHAAIEKNKASFKGTAIHNYLERCLWKHMSRHPNKNYIIERRLWDRLNGRKISGKFDCFLNGALYDYKTCSVWKRIMGDWSEYIAQLNIYDYMLGLCGVKVNILYIIAWYLDWNKGRPWDRPEGYPEDEIELIHIDEKWSRNIQKDYLYSRIDLQKEAEPLPDDDLPHCTDEEMWSKPSTWAVMRPGQKRAVRTKDLNSKEDCEEYIRKSTAKDKDSFIIEHRPGTRTRCAEYCHCNAFCNVWQEFKKEAA